MLKIENVDVYGWEAAIRGARNPMNSWERMDSWHCTERCDCDGCVLSGEGGNCKGNLGSEYEYAMGHNDYKLLTKLANAGPDHGKFLRMITVTMDINAPFYWWKEFSTYKVGTVANSCSTMHKIHSKPFVLDDFSHEHLDYTSMCCLENLIDHLNYKRDEYNRTKSKDDWWQMIQLLPTSYNQKRTVMLNYQVLKNIYHARKNHKLDCWHTFCDWIESLPYSELITGSDAV